MRILYLDCFSGISGDMTVAALADAGADRGYMESELQKLQLEPYTLHWKTVIKCGVSALKFDVVLDPEHPPVHHRHYADIVNAIEKAGFNERVTTLSLAIFEKIGKAEGKIHHIPLEKVHFHEVGAIDSIVDIVATALAIDSLQVERIFASPVPLGSGTVRCDHGLYPIPAPATLEMMRGVPIAPTSHRKEMTTPTGAAIVSVLADDFHDGLPPFIVESIGYGAGTRDLPQQPNVLRAIIGEAEQLRTAWQPFKQHEHNHSHGHDHVHEHNNDYLVGVNHSHSHSHDHDHSHTQDHEHNHNHDHDHDHQHDHGHKHDNNR